MTTSASITLNDLIPVEDARESTCQYCGRTSPDMAGEAGCVSVGFATTPDGDYGCVPCIVERVMFADGSPS